MLPSKPFKQIALVHPLPQVLSMPRTMPLLDSVPGVPGQPFSFQGLVNQSSLNIRLLGTSLGYDNDIDDIKKPAVTMRQPNKTMNSKGRKLFDESSDEIIFRKHFPRQLEINKFLESLKRERDTC